MKIIASVLIALAIMGTIVLYSPFSVNTGLRFGYYGELNDILHEIEKSGRLEVLDVWQHRDISLEDFGITLRTESDRECVIEIVDYGNVRDSSDIAKGVMIFGEEYRKVQRFDFKNESVWSEIGYPKFPSIRGLLPVLDRFLVEVEQSNEEFVDLDWEESYDYIRIRYISKGEQDSLGDVG